MMSRVLFVVNLGLAWVIISSTVLAQPQIAPGRGPRSEPPAPTTLPEIPPLPDSQVRAELRRWLGRDNFSFRGSAITLSVQRPYDSASQIDLGFRNATYAFSGINRAWFGQRELTGVVEVSFPPASEGLYAVDCALWGTREIQWRGRHEGSGTVTVIDDHAVFVVPATFQNTIAIRPVEAEGWGFHSCRLQPLQ